MESKPTHIWWRAVATLLLTALICSCASAAVDVSISVEVSPEKVNAGDTFDVKINITNEDVVDLEPNDDIELAISVDGVLVHEDIAHEGISANASKVITVGSGSFSTEDGNVWVESLLGYKCGSMDVDVSVSGDVSADSAQDSVEIKGEKLYVDMKPSEPSAAGELNVSVEDKDGDPLDDVSVRITQLSGKTWNIEDPRRETSTDDGVATFDPLGEYTRFQDNLYSTYQLDVWDDNFCLYTKSFELTNSLRIKDVFPAAPYTGDEIRARIVDSGEDGVEGAKLAVSGSSGVIGSYVSDNTGYVRFNIQNGGTYTLLASKSGFTNSATVSLKVMNKESMSLKVEPTKQAIGKEVTITVTAGSRFVEGASVTIEKPDKTKDTLSTSSSGKVVYTPNAAGSYTVIVKKDGYETTSASFAAANFFSVTFQTPKVHESVAVSVKDQDGRGISGASVTVQGSSVSGSTDENGRFSFKLDTAGEYTLDVKKTGFADFSQKMTVYGTLSVAVDPAKLNLDDSVSIKVSDEGGAAVEANIEVQKPDGAKENVVKSAYTFTPQTAGAYKINATKAYYLPAEGGFEVNPYLLELDAWLSGKDLTVKAARGGSPVEGLNVSVLTPKGKELFLKTNAEGLAKLDIKELNETGVFTVASVDANYEKKTVTREIKGLGGDILPLLLIGIAMLVMLVFIVFIVFYISHRRSRNSAWSTKPKKPRGGIGLGGI